MDIHEYWMLQDLGLRHIKDQNWDAAKDVFETILDKKRACDALCHHTLGFLYAREKAYSQAAMHYRLLAELEPHDIPNWLHLLNAYYELNEHELMARTALRILKLDPASQSALQALYDAITCLEAEEEAESMCRHALLALPNDPHLNLTLATILADRGNYTVAAVFFRHAVHFFPEESQAWLGACFELAECFNQMNQFGEALPWYARVVSADPDYPDALFPFAACLVYAGQYEDARRSLEKLCDDDPDHPAYRFLLGLVYQKTGDETLANEEFATAIPNLEACVHSTDEVLIDCVNTVM
jgi:tetratricopeptide (TPR) repeat protein